MKRCSVIHIITVCLLWAFLCEAAYAAVGIIPPPPPPSTAKKAKPPNMRSERTRELQEDKNITRRKETSILPKILLERNLDRGAEMKLVASTSEGYRVIELPNAPVERKGGGFKRNFLVQKDNRQKIMSLRVNAKGELLR